MATVAVREKPILFSGRLVRAILDGRKTQTRRIVEPQPVWEEQPVLCNDGIWRGRYTGERAVIEYDRDGNPFPSYPEPVEEIEERRCPYGQPGDRLWVRETWQFYGWSDDGEPLIRYRADGATAWPEFPEEWVDRANDIWAELSKPENYRIDNRAADRRWRPSIHMPRWASRITLEITGVRVERLQDISEDDARAEGAEYYVYGHGPVPDSAVYCEGGYHNAAGSYRAGLEMTWNEINERRGYGWDANPWVWALTFRVVPTPE